jgi:hypothetical protein
MEGAEQGSHHGVEDFRVGGKIFATLAYIKQGSGVLFFTPAQQAGMVADAPEMFSPVPNAWGRGGATLVHLEKMKPDILRDAMQTSWRNRVEKSSAVKRRRVRGV